MRRIAPVLLLLLACSRSESGDPQPDASRPEPDAPPSQADASVDGMSTPDARVDETSEVIQCSGSVAAATAGICDATQGSGTAVVLRGDILGEVDTYLDGEVVYDGDRIVCAGCDCSSAPGYDTATRIDCGGAAISPGLINAHSHLSYEDRWPLASTAAGGTRYEHRHDWRLNVSTPSNQYGNGRTSAGMRWNELRHMLAGTTSMAASTTATGMVRNLDELTAEDSAHGFEPVTYEVFALGDGNGTYRANCGWNFQYSELEMALLPSIVTHTSEGINGYAHDEFLCQSGAAGGSRDFVEKNTAHIHGIGLSATDYYGMARDHAKLVWSPRSNVSLYGNTADAALFKRLGGTVALGTDWTYSGSANIGREMACADSLDTTYYGDAFSDRDIWLMATQGAAAATGSSSKLGSLTAGKTADIAIFAATEGQLHRATFTATTADVALVVRDGRVLYGESDVVAALGGGCDAIDVCGDARQICTSREYGITFDALATAVGGTVPGYPVVFCDTPPNEPTCVPSRPGEYTAPSVQDPDGDGRVDGDDNCPSVFNPVRPMDNGAQPDTDADGQGDACDPTPLGLDLDGDGRNNDVDGCFAINDGGGDSDGDGRGDSCDACPDQPNRDHVCFPPPVAISQIQTELLSGTEVIVEDVTVTAVDDRGFHAQDPSIASGENAGVYVFIGYRPNLQVGDKVSFGGVTSEYFQLTEVARAGIVARSADGQPIAPIAVTSAQASEERYEGTLVEIAGVSKTDVPHLCSADNAACNDDDLWEIDDAIVVYDLAWQGTRDEWSNGAALIGIGSHITGVMSFRFDRRRLLPRSMVDLIP